VADSTTVPGELWTIGHWTCPPDVVLETLGSAGITLLADVRRTPGSRASPQFNPDQLSSWLAAAGIGYVHLPKLGGRRPRSTVVDPATNAGWQNAGFRNYADYTLTPDYEDGLAQLAGLARSGRVAIMCGEPMPWRCHRLLIATTLTARGWAVTHLMTNARPQPHRLGRWGATPVVRPDGVVTYPAQPDGAADPRRGDPPGGAARPDRVPTG
jgi:uncharacterized protein (DUF488 family)